MVSESQSRRRVLGSLVAAGGALALGTAATPASAASAPSGTRATVVLVHGVFADASGWNEVSARLLKAGHDVIAPANPLRDLAQDAQYISSVVATLPGPVIMVGHSYGGEVITNSALANPNVKALVYVAAFAPDQGETALELAGRFPGSQLPGALLTRAYPVPGSSEPGIDGYIDPAKFHDAFAQDLPRSLTRVMAVAQRPGSVGGLGAPSGAPAWKSLPSWYVVAGADRVIPPAAQRFMAERAGSRVVEVKGASHVVMMSHPDAVVRQIRAAHRAIR
ncbi:alpha/beta fold hydrolase [Streptomyces sp. S.PB5]|uniref:alpha/beta fold hydrolase n=1 Tax=Streptomyces sp. S.PB5 TaxID=3020844 RepID=UPI0025B0984E|nr:alpha/beta fold hydrolase [Streptomyces sp. S.PB5]MDN3026819.1 alpha/beta fold hydrolase [Streptomyces sp. S.PB5]